MRTIKTTIATLLLIAPFAANAVFSYDIFECDGATGGTCTTPIGFIELPTASGSQLTGTGIDFEYFSAFAGSYDEDDIQSIDWVADSTTRQLTSFSLRTDTDPGCLAGTSPLPCSTTSQRMDLISIGLMETSPSSGSCISTPTGPACTSSIRIGPANLFVPGATTVVEPGTLALLGIGLAGMGLSRRRKKA